MTPRRRRRSSSPWTGYYRWTARRPPREHLLRTLDHIDWEGGRPPRGTAIELGFGAGTDTLELLRRGWRVLAIDGERAAAAFLDRRVPAEHRRRLTIVVGPMETIALPPADLIYASFSLPFCPPDGFRRVWAAIRASLKPGGHFAGQLFGDRDEWRPRQPTMTFHSLSEVRRLARGFSLELLRETTEAGMSYHGPKRWHYFDVILEKPRSARRRSGRRRRARASPSA